MLLSVFTVHSYFIEFDSNIHRRDEVLTTPSLYTNRIENSRMTPNNDPSRALSARRYAGNGRFRRR